MAFVVNTAKTLRTHWKKSTFGFCLAVYGVKYVNNKHNDNLLRREYCDEARKYGHEKIELGHRPRRVTVFLNPAAREGKARKLFEKTAAPILYVAGIEVNVVATEYEGQVKNFMTVLDTEDTDAVIVAGGDGTLLEAVTGFLRKEDRDFSENIPLGVIPLGKTNRFSKILFGPDLDEVKMIAEAAIAVVRAVTKKVDVIKFDGGEGKTIYSLCGLEVGAYRDAEDRKSKYWYFGPLKHRWTYVRTAMKDWPPVINAQVSYLEANEENMAGEDEVVGKKKNSGQSWSFFNFLFRRNQRDAKWEAEQKAKEEERRKEEAAQMVTSDVATVEMTVTTSTLVDSEAPLKSLQMGLGPSDPGKMDVIREGSRRMKERGFSMGSPDDQRLLAKKIHIEPKEEEERWFNIDGEAFEAMPVDITLLRNKLNFFCPQPQPATS
ncbi:acylglycerol kinase, mitochondrial isoform X2 [Aplysia californica]|uniref:Acylglycerol kinase, mitochondrial n=1 Tax=Aplysia californica TaxID=6500 RepID=A0ABM1A3M6_APLCA|nr:acylglycerol kinase, mitochondrial isoform X2 [Aplysia californica]